jgi:hypothetical protein
MEKSGGMKFIKKAFAPKEVKAAVGVLEEFTCRFQNNAFELVRGEIENTIFTDVDDLVRALRDSDGKSPREWVLCQIVNIAGDWAESGRFHIFRGLLNQIGEDLLKVYDAGIDELVQMKAMNPNLGTKEKGALRRNIRGVGIG